MSDIVDKGENVEKGGGCKETGGGEKRMEKVTRRESKNPTYSSCVQLLFYSTKHTVVLIRACSLHSTQPH